MKIKSYVVNEVFYSPQGEGARAGEMSVFLRFAGCNLQCAVEREGFNCDTDFAKGDRLSLAEVIQRVLDHDEVYAATKGSDVLSTCGWVVLTGGEPTLQADDALVAALHEAGYRVAIETNGTNPLPRGLDFVACSPKKGHKPLITSATEVRVVLGAVGEIPDPQGIRADYYFVSPAFKAPPVEVIAGWKASPADKSDALVAWALHYIRQNPRWRLSLQTHKLLGVR